MFIVTYTIYPARDNFKYTPNYFYTYFLNFTNYCICPMKPKLQKNVSERFINPRYTFWLISHTLQTIVTVVIMPESYKYPGQK